MDMGRSGACSERERSWRGAGPMTGLTGRERRVPGGAKGFPAAVQGTSVFTGLASLCPIGSAACLMFVQLMS